MESVTETWPLTTFLIEPLVSDALADRCATDHLNPDSAVTEPILDPQSTELLAEIDLDKITLLIKMRFCAEELVRTEIVL
jgi:hypothetical protein